MDLKASYAHAKALYESSRWPEAIAVYRAIVAVHPAELQAWALMGLCATQAGDLALATMALRQAVVLEPTAANIHFRLGIVLYRQGFADDAEAAFRRTIALDPSNADAVQNLAAVLVDRGRGREAQPYFEQLIARDPRHELAWAGLANIHLAANDRAAAIQCLEQAVAINPANTATRHLLMAAKGERPQHPDWSYVESFFDDYADRFEHHLVNRLNYVAPQTLTEVIQAAMPQRRFNSVLDLGCGTGLFGAAFRHVFPGDVLVGVDLSRRMVQAASARKIYTDAHKAEASAYLRGTFQTFDLIAATDVLIYVGDVTELIQQAAQRLNPTGLLAFTIETTDAPGFVLEQTGRYAHNRADLVAVAHHAGLDVVTERAAPLRQHGAQNEVGLYLVFQRR
ncbi:MAG: tetratricopeptide repeat protein [Rhodospirillaceae bacterium]|nr:tetratricopeptide repeat protein [Rhodospirillaceae bacterium]